MVDQHYHSQLSQETIRHRPASSGNIVLMKRLGFSTDPQGLLLVPDAGNRWNGSQFLSTAQQCEFCSHTVDHVSLQFTSVRSSDILTSTQANTIVMYSPVLGRSPNQHLALPPNEVCHVYSDTIEYLNDIWMLDLIDQRTSTTIQ
jgi:hypothetical protein